MSVNKSKPKIYTKNIKQMRIKIRRGKRFSQKQISNNLVFAGVNPAGVRSKWPTWTKIIRESQSSVWTMQETKSTETNKLKMKDFIIYEKVRELKEGGGVAIAAKTNLNPVLTAEGEDDVEAISIDIHPSKIIISCTSAYGPQQKDNIDKKSRFWKYLDNMVDDAWKEGKGFYLQGDLNAWIGPSFISADPNEQNENGKLFQRFLNRHKQLILVNSLSLCQGLITRKRDLINGKSEKSIIDFVVVCNRVLPYVTNMVIDEANKYITTNYTQVKKNIKAINSDHNTEFVMMNLQVMPIKKVKREIYNLKNFDCQKAFKKQTEDTHEFSACLNSSDSVMLKSDKWIKCLDAHIKKSFKKVKVDNKKARPSASDALIDKQNALKNTYVDAQLKQALDVQIVEILLKEEIEKA